MILSEQHHSKCKSRKKHHGRKNLERPYVQKAIEDLWKYVHPDIGKNMRKLMENEFGLKEREAEEYVINEKMRLLKNKCIKEKTFPCFPFPPLRPQPPKSDFFCPIISPCDPCSSTRSPCPPEFCWPPDFIGELQRLICESKKVSSSDERISTENGDGDRTSGEEVGEGLSRIDEDGENMEKVVVEKAEEECPRPPDMLDMLRCVLSTPPCPIPCVSPPPPCPPTNLVGQLNQMLCPNSCPPPNTSTCPPSPPPCPPPPPDILCALKEMFCPTCPPQQPCQPCPPCSPKDIMKRLLCEGQGSLDIPIPQIPPDCPCPPPNYLELLRESVCPPAGPTYPCTYVVKPPKRRKRIRKTVGLRYYWFKEMTNLLTPKLNDYVAMMLSRRRPPRARCLAEIILKTLCDITGEKCTLNSQKTRAQKMLVFLADRIALWLAKLSCSCDERARELCGKEDEDDEEDDDTANGGNGEKSARKSSVSDDNTGGDGSSGDKDKSGTIRKSNKSGTSKTTSQAGKSAKSASMEAGDMAVKSEPATDESVNKGEDEEDHYVHGNKQTLKTIKQRKVISKHFLQNSKINITKGGRTRHTITKKKSNNKTSSNLKPSINTKNEIELTNLEERKEFKTVLTNIIGNSNVSINQTKRSKDVAAILQRIIEKQISNKNIKVTKNNGRDEVEKMFNNIGVWIDKMANEAEKEFLLSKPNIKEKIRLQRIISDKSMILQCIELEGELKRM